MSCHRPSPSSRTTLDHFFIMSVVVERRRESSSSSWRAANNNRRHHPPTTEPTSSSSSDNDVDYVDIRRELSEMGVDVYGPLSRYEEDLAYLFGQFSENVLREGGEGRDLPLSSY